jgi:hypothetical protein
MSSSGRNTIVVVTLIYTYFTRENINFSASDYEIVQEEMWIFLVGSDYVYFRYRKKYLEHKPLSVLGEGIRILLVHVWVYAYIWVHDYENISDVERSKYYIRYL